MKISFLLMICGLSGIFANVSSQTIKLNLTLKNVTLKEVIENIEQQTDFKFLYREDLIDINKRTSIEVSETNLEDLMSNLLYGSKISYSLFNDNLIVLSPIQTNKITGKVTDATTGEPLPGVNVVVEETTIGAVTDINGNYQIDILDENAVLIFSYVGYLSESISIAGRTVIDVALSLDIAQLEEVVVIGYGTIKKGDVTSSIATIKADDFIQGGVKDIGQLIQGKVAGLTVYSVSGDPTSNTQVKLRGNNTLFGTFPNPLILIDGVPGDFNSVAPEDIESIDVLKDGSAAAIYGTRGTNGVIIITTKRASGQYKSSVEYNGYISTSTIARKLDILTAEDYRSQIAEGTRLASFDKGATTDWMDEITQTPVSYVQSLTFQGGDNRTNFLASVNYEDTEGIIKRTDNNVFTARADINHSMFENLIKINLGLLNRHTKNTTTADGFGFSGYTYRQALIRNPTEPIKDEEGNLNEDRNLFYYENPLGHLYESDGENKSQWSRMNGTITINPARGLNFKGLFSFSKYDQTRAYAETRQHFRNSNGYVSNGTRETIDRLVELTADYSGNIGNHRYTILGGYGYQDYDMRDYWMRNVDFPTDIFGYSNIDLGQGFDYLKPLSEVSGLKEKTNLISFFARATYNYKDKYLLLSSLRHEAGSQLVGTKKPWGTFPSISVGWRISNEPFLKNVKVINELKIRAGYGITGTLPNRLYHGIATIAYSSDPILVDGEYLKRLAPSRNSNPYLRWEEKKETNLGLDFSIVNNRVSGTIDYYIREVNGLLYEFPVPVPPNQVPSTFANAGSMSNKGLEILLNITPLRTDKFEWMTSFNFSTNKNKLKSLGNEEYQYNGTWLGTGDAGEPIWDYTHRLDVGGPIGNFWGYKVVDVTDDGQWIYLDSLNNRVEYLDFVQSYANRHILGNGIPKYFVGWNNTVRYKNFDLSVSVRGAFKFQILNRQRMYFENTQIDYYNRLKSAYDPVFGKAVLNKNMPLQYNSYYIEDGDYVKIDNLSLGYTLYGKGSRYFKSAKIYFSTLNLLTLSKYKGIDPEVNIIGLEPGNDDRDKYPTTRTFTLGLKISF